MKKSILAVAGIIIFAYALTIDRYEPQAMGSPVAVDHSDGSSGTSRVESGEAGKEGSLGASIDYVPITDEEYNVLKSAGMFSHTYIYELDYPNGAAGVDIWVDHYTGNGNQKETMMRMGTDFRGGTDEMTKLYLSALDAGDSREIWVLSIRQGGTISSTNATVAKENVRFSVSGNVWLPKEVVEGEPINLAVIKRSSVESDSYGMSIGGEADETELKDGEEMFVLRCQINSI